MNTKWGAVRRHSSAAVNSPSHYIQTHGEETIDVIRDALTEEGFIGFCNGNRIKYLDRMGHKVQPAPTWRSVLADIKQILFWGSLTMRQAQAIAAAKREDTAKAEWYARMAHGDDPRLDERYRG